jgi:hypothetical protein
MRHDKAPPGFRLPPLASEPIPDFPPESGVRFITPEEDPEGFRVAMAGGIRIVGSITYELLDSAWRLVELSYARQGRFSEGMAIPASSRAAAMGAIAVACAAFEAVLNEVLFQSQTNDESNEAVCQNNLLEILLKVSPRERLQGIAAVAQKNIEWDKEPFQSLEQLLSVRKHLLHHEPELYIPDRGFWPAKKLKELPHKIGSPYPTDAFPDGPPLGWHEHIFTPTGAEWAVRCVYKIVALVESCEHVIGSRFPGTVTYGSSNPRT